MSSQEDKDAIRIVNEYIGGKTTVYVDMVGDLFHYNHMKLLKNARNFGDYVIVGIHNDADVATYKRIPIMTMTERIEAVYQSGLADKIIPNAPLYPTEQYCHEHGIDLVMHADDFNEEKLNKFYGSIRHRLVLVPYGEGISTSDLIGRIRERYCHSTS